MSDLKEAYDRDGYLILDWTIEPDLCAKVAATTRAINGSPLDCWPTNDDILELAFHPKILTLLRHLYGREPFPFQTLNYKSSPEQGIHSDMLHFSSLPAHFMCGVWVALEPVDARNGPLFYYPKSHAYPFVSFQDLGITPSTDNAQFHRNLGEYTRWLEKFVSDQGLQRSLFTCAPGMVLIWAANTVHGSIKKVDTWRSRCCQVTHYYFMDCQYYTPAFSEPPEQMHWREPFGMVKKYQQKVMWSL